ncbi:hypothetical protein Rhe02_24160 [Rhizocola hellebori]|uniref:HTH cro/C1-type domain-containing protein n=1 Tax=Rhizocola hellebori TaxID=1392758 RepID=A0A8J3Q5N0_9ACTN|nr:hypothetical protein Rhe02_24160 [Rhizocola hellebori]
MGLSQEALAEQLGVDRTTVIRWERGQSEPQPWQRPNLAMALKVSVEELAVLLDSWDLVVPQAPAVLAANESCELGFDVVMSARVHYEKMYRNARCSGKAAHRVLSRPPCQSGSAFQS